MQGFFVFMGGAFDFWYQEQSMFRILETAMCGMILVGILLWTFVRFVYQMGTQEIVVRWRAKTLTRPDLLFVVAMLVFSLMNAVAISILRSSFGDFVYLIGNYKIYPTLALVFVYLLVMLTWRQIALRFVGVLVKCSDWRP